MQLICDGVQPKREVLDHTIEQFKEVYIKAKREFEVVVNVCVPPRSAFVYCRDAG